MLNGFAARLVALGPKHRDIVIKARCPFAGHQPGTPSTGRGKGLAAQPSALSRSGSASSTCAHKPLRGASASCSSKAWPTRRGWLACQGAQVDETTAPVTPARRQPTRRALGPAGAELVEQGQGIPQRAALAANAVTGQGLGVQRIELRLERGLGTPDEAVEQVVCVVARRHLACAGDEGFVGSCACRADASTNSRGLPGWR